MIDINENRIPGWMTINDLEIIKQLASSVPKNGAILEVGSLYGRSAVTWASYCDPSVTVYCCDIFYDRYIDIHDLDLPFAPISNQVYNAWEEFQKNTKQFKNIVPIRGAAPDVEYNGDMLDILFVDASHSNPSDWNIIDYFSKFVKSGGLISGHDNRPEFPDVTDNINSLVARYNSPTIQYSLDSSIWAVSVTK